MLVEVVSAEKDAVNACFGPAAYGLMRQPEVGVISAVPDRLERRRKSRCARGTFRAAHHRFLSLTYDNIGRSNREDENTVLKELVPIEACLNSSKAGLSGF